MRFFCKAFLTDIELTDIYKSNHFWRDGVRCLEMLFEAKLLHGEGFKTFDAVKERLVKTWLFSTLTIAIERLDYSASRLRNHEAV